MGHCESSLDGYDVHVVAREATPVNNPVPMRALATALRGSLPALPLLTALNYLNYLDRQIVYGMLGVIGTDLSLNQYQLGLLATVNLLLFAVSSMLSGPLAHLFPAPP